MWIFAILNVYGVHSAWQTAVIKMVPGLSIEPIAILITVNTSLSLIAHQSSCSDTYNFECNRVFVDCF